MSKGVYFDHKLIILKGKNQMIYVIAFLPSSKRKTNPQLIFILSLTQWVDRT